jgi:hypothetical protein
MLETVRSIIIIIGLVLQELMTHRFGHDKPLFDISSLVVIGAAVIVLSLAIRRPYGYNFLRRMFFPQACCEGVWAEQVGVKERKYSIGLIRFDPNERQWRYTGIAYGDDYRPAAQWESLSQTYDDKNYHWHFAGTAFYLGPDPNTGHVHQTSDKFQMQTTLIIAPKDDANMEGFAIDITHDTAKNPTRASGFHIKLRRADHLVPDDQATLDDLKKMPSKTVREVFENLEMIIEGGLEHENVNSHRH